MKKPFVLALLGVLLFATGCSDCTDWTYTWCDYVKSSEHLVIKTPDGQWTASDTDVYFSPPDIDFFQGINEDICLVIEAFFPDKKISLPGHHYLYISMVFDKWENGKVISLENDKEIRKYSISAYEGDYFFDNAEITGGTLKVLALGPKDVHIRIQGLKVKGTPTKGKYAGQAVEWEIKTVIDYECKPTRKTLCQDSRHNPF